MVSLDSIDRVTLKSIADIVLGDLPLPVQPQISPATCLAGVFLLLTGFLYSYLAIRWQPVLIFLSVAYSLSIPIAVS
jgi:hypothetical protein